MEKYHRLWKYRFLLFSCFIRLFIICSVTSSEIQKIIFFGLSYELIQTVLTLLLIILDGLFYVDNILYIMNMKAYIEIRIGGIKTERLIYKRCVIAILLNILLTILFSNGLVQCISFLFSIFYNLISGYMFILLCKYLNKEITNKLIIIYFVLMICVRVCFNYFI